MLSHAAAPRLLKTQTRASYSYLSKCDSATLTMDMKEHPEGMIARRACVRGPFAQREP